MITYNFTKNCTPPVLFWGKQFPNTTQTLKSLTKSLPNTTQMMESLTKSLPNTTQMMESPMSVTSSPNPESKMTHFQYPCPVHQILVRHVQQRSPCHHMNDLWLSNGILAALLLYTFYDIYSKGKHNLHHLAQLKDSTIHSEVWYIVHTSLNVSAGEQNSFRNHRI